MLKYSILAIQIILFISTLNLYTDDFQDTLSYYDPLEKQVVYTSKDIILSAVRFDVHRPGYLRKIELTLAGSDTSNTVFVHIFGQEAGLPAPILERDIIEPIKIKKSKNGFEKISININEELFLENDQFFVCLEAKGHPIYLVSDNAERLPFCNDENSGKYYGQYFKHKDGNWSYGYYDFLVDVYIEYPEVNQYSIFEEILLSDKDYKEKSDLIDTLYYNNSIALSDIDFDGLPDLLFDGRLYKNIGDFYFKYFNNILDTLQNSLANFFIDMNADGKIDIIILGINKENEMTNSLFLNEGDHFIEQELKIEGIGNPVSFSIADVNGDGLPDLFITQYSTDSSNQYSNKLLINNSKNGFDDKTTSLYSKNRLHKSKGCFFTDFDNDNDFDLYVVNDDCDNELWENFGNLVFRNTYNEKSISDEQLSYISGNNYRGYGSDINWRDINNDGNIDYIVPKSLNINNKSDGTANGTKVYINEGSPKYNSVSSNNYNLELEEEHKGSVWGDINNDGLIDLILTTGCNCRYSELYLQKSNKKFEKSTHLSGFFKRPLGDDALLADINKDGKLDLITYENNQLKIFKNVLKEGKNFVSINCESDNKILNNITQLDAFSNDLFIRQTIPSGEGLLMQSPINLHIGLDNNVKIDTLIIKTISDTLLKAYNLDANKEYNLNKIEFKKEFKESISNSVFPNPFIDKIKIMFEIKNTSRVAITILNINGDVIKDLIDEEFLPGNHEIIWDGKGNSGEFSPNGTYLYSINTGTKEVKGKIIKIN